MNGLVRDTRLLTALACQGRALAGGESVGPVCGRTFTGRPAWGPLLDQARACGWRVGYRADGTPDAMCPQCARHDPETVALCRELARRG